MRKIYSLANAKTVKSQLKKAFKFANVHYDHFLRGNAKEIFFFVNSRFVLRKTVKREVVSSVITIHFPKEHFKCEILEVRKPFNYDYLLVAIKF